ncbi:conserved hypothetical protein [Paecilomyces variotii No. 5]|uniref:DUF7514 domain-containing protein n=1 Tax=Byssochlamys spectabilis (strain No. 5 / NBRC 109023) TaxID=1356009 RepID=V5FAK9_BYSSN|nr:conserved hypothetical protein [Paecilomyces variotii No. 5]
MAYHDGDYRSPSVGPYEQRVSSDDLAGSDPRRHSGYSTPYTSHYAGDRVDMPEPRAKSPHPSSSYQKSQGYPPYGGQDGYGHQQQQGGINDAIHSAFYKSHPSNYLSPEVLNQITDQVVQQLKNTGLYSAQEQQQQSRQSSSPQATGHAQSSHSAAPTHDAKHNANTPPSPHRSPRGYPSPQQQSRYPPPPSERKESPSTQTSDTVKEIRPKAPPRAPTIEELTTLEKIWEKLFEDGKPTKRLGQFLRGIAVHLIEDYPPGNTIVVLPDKLQKFYEDTKVPSDPYPWHDIFDDNTSSISRLYRAIEAEHHLVQGKLDERPDIPGLTPRGFERWASLMILAHPEREFERLQKAVLAMPISNPDNRKERFPKEIPRRLFPEAPDLAVREKLDKAIITHCGVHLPPITEEERSKAAASHRRTASKEKASGPSSATTEPTNSHAERGRPRQETHSSAVSDDEEEAVPARPIERERKPYIAQPGGGKVYGDSPPPRHSHAESFSSSTRPKEYVFAPTSASGPRSYNHAQDPTYPRTGADTGLYPPASGNSRSRSPSFGAGGSAYRHSESDLFSGGGGHGGYSGNGPYSASATSAFPDDVFDDAHTRRYHYDRGTEDGRTYDTLRDRERDRVRENPRYHAYPVHGNWGSDEDYYRGMLGGQGGGPVEGGSYKTYTYR